MKRFYPLIGMAGAVLLLLGALLQITQMSWAPYVYLSGAVLFAWMQLQSEPSFTNLVIRRLRRQQLLGAALLIVAGVLMLFWHRNEWIVCLSVAAVLQLYTAFRIPQEEARAKK